MDGRPAGAVTNAAVERPAPASLWRDMLYRRLRRQPVPLVWTRDDLVAAASLWAGARRWTAWWRAQDVGPGDRVVCALPPGPGFMMVLVAALWDDLTFVPAPAGADVESLLDVVDARYAVVPPGRRAGAAIVAATRAGTPPDAAVIPRPARVGPTCDARFLVETRGTTAAPRRVALSDANVRAVLASHTPLLAGDGAVVLSVLPWHHAFGLVLEVLPALLTGAELLRDPSDGRDATTMLAVAAEHPVTHVHAVPDTVRLLAERDEGRALLGRLRGGVIGGAPIDAPLPTCSAARACAWATVRPKPPRVSRWGIRARGPPGHSGGRSAVTSASTLTACSRSAERTRASACGKPMPPEGSGSAWSRPGVGCAPATSPGESRTGRTRSKAGPRTASRGRTTGASPPRPGSGRCVPASRRVPRCCCSSPDGRTFVVAASPWPETRRRCPGLSRALPELVGPFAARTPSATTGRRLLGGPRRDAP